jgi:hypothetical protein
MFVSGFGQAWGAVQSKVGLPQVQLATALLPLMLIENIGESSFLLPLGIPWFYALLAFLVLAQSTKHAEIL